MRPPSPTVVEDDRIDAVLSFPAVGLSERVDRCAAGRRRRGGGGHGGRHVDALLFLVVDEATSAGEAGAGAARHAAQQVPVTRLRRVVDVYLPRRHEVVAWLRRVAAPQTLTINQSSSSSSSY